MGFGIDCFYYLADRYSEYASVVGIATVAFIAIMYLFDFTEWQSRAGKVFRKATWWIFVGGITMLVLLLTGEYPYGPICLFAFLTPMWLVTVKNVFYSDVRTRTYVSWLSGPLLFISLLTGIVWFIWTFLRDENEWNEITRVTSAEAAGCEPDLETYPECASANNPEEACFTTDGHEIIFEDGCDETCVSVYENCINTFILWVGPLLVGLVLFFLSFFCAFLRTDNDAERDVINFAKLWIFLLFTIWLTASLAGIAAGVSTALLAITLAAFIGSAIFMASSMRHDERKVHAKGFWERIKDKWGDHLDIVRGMATVLLAPVAIIYLILSMINQSVRRIGLPVSKSFGTEEERKDFVTKRARSQIRTFKSWDRSKILVYAVLWGFAFMVLQVIVARFTVLFLSWLIEMTSPLGLGAVTGIMVGVGLLMFMLPPVPGVPIYLTLGIVVLATGRETLGIIGCMAYGAAVSLVLKLLACTLQQKAIGEQLSHYVSVRKAVQINSNLIKSMRLILGQKRWFSVDKVAILIGGPDWPTSVLCGLMKLDLIPILLGTTPVIFLILPTMLTGSFTYMAGLTTEAGQPEFPWAGALATISAALTAIVQFGSMIVAAYYLEQTASQRTEELDAIEVDEEVKVLEDKEKHLNQCYREVTQWPKVPLMAKLTLFVSFATMVTCCYMVQLFSGACFAEYQLTYTIDEHLDGDWKNLILPLGRVAVLLFLVSMVLLWAFYSWAQCKAKSLAQATVSPEEAHDVVIEANSHNAEANDDGVEVDESQVNSDETQRPASPPPGSPPMEGSHPQIEVSIRQYQEGGTPKSKKSSPRKSAIPALSTPLM